MLPFCSNDIKGKVFITSKLTHEPGFAIIPFKETKKYYFSAHTVRNTAKANCWLQDAMTYKDEFNSLSSETQSLGA